MELKKSSYASLGEYLEMVQSRPRLQSYWGFLAFPVGLGIPLIFLKAALHIHLKVMEKFCL